MILLCEIVVYSRKFCFKSTSTCTLNMFMRLEHGRHYFLNLSNNEIARDNCTLLSAWLGHMGNVKGRITISNVVTCSLFVKFSVTMITIDNCRLRVTVIT